MPASTKGADLFGAFLPLYPDIEGAGVLHRIGAHGQGSKALIPSKRTRLTKKYNSSAEVAFIRAKN